MASYRLNYRRVAEIAAAEWGIEWSLDIKRVRQRLNPQTGLYTIRADCWAWHRLVRRQLGREHVVVAEMFHRIRLVSDRPRDWLLHALAHELTHAAQAERFGWDGWARVVREQNRLPYEDRWIEQEADRIADERWELLIPAVS